MWGGYQATLKPGDRIVVVGGGYEGANEGWRWGKMWWKRGGSIGKPWGNMVKQQPASIDCKHMCGPEIQHFTDVHAPGASCQVALVSSKVSVFVRHAWDWTDLRSQFRLIRRMQPVICQCFGWWEFGKLNPMDDIDGTCERLYLNEPPHPFWRNYIHWAKLASVCMFVSQWLAHARFWLWNWDMLSLWFQSVCVRNTNRNEHFHTPCLDCIHGSIIFMYSPFKLVWGHSMDRIFQKVLWLVPLGCNCSELLGRMLAILTILAFFWVN